MWTCSKTVVLLLLQVVIVAGTETRTKRQTTVDLGPGNWPSCKEGAEAPPTRVNTADYVTHLRTYFATAGIHAYLIPSEDAHQSEYPSSYDKRRGFISGFKGSAGYAVVTIDKAALWTDGRYFLEAEDTLDCHWILMRQREMGVPTMTEWVTTELSRGQRLGASPFLVGNSKWRFYKEELAIYGISLLPIQDELIDRFWREAIGRPPQPDTPINALPLQYSGRSWQDKIADMRAEMEFRLVDMLVITGLDETAWLFNLRASDISYNPFFISYAILEDDHITLYILNHTNKITAEPTDEASTTTAAAHLNTNPDGTCTGRTELCVEVKQYDPYIVLEDIRTKANDATRVWLSYSCNQAIYMSVPVVKMYQANTPIATSKSRKNSVEVEGMKESHIRDAVALVSFIAKLDKEVKAGITWTELTAANALNEYRYAQDKNRGLSFSSISSSGPNGAIIHYRPTPSTDRQLSTSELYLLDSGAQYFAQERNRGLSFETISASGLNGAIIHYAVSNLTDRVLKTTDVFLLDSGGQYLDGTTDVTRTFHFGTPTQYQKECYTRVLMGHINLFQAMWPLGLYGRELDAFARSPLWDVGLVYRHGTGHGIGMYLSVHEGPGRITGSIAKIHTDNILDINQFFSDGPVYISKSTMATTFMGAILNENQFVSDEPGYYEDGQFGIRLENIVMVKNASTKYQFPGTHFLTFEHVTLVPYEPSLIDISLLTDKQIKYLNDYNILVRERVGPKLQGEAYDWMMEKTAPYVSKSEPSAQKNSDCSKTVYSFNIIVTLLFLASIIKPY